MEKIIGKKVTIYFNDTLTSVSGRQGVFLGETDGEYILQINGVETIFPKSKVVRMEVMR